MTFRGVLVATVLAAAMTGVSPLPGQAVPPTDVVVNQLYYTVTDSYQGAPENLWEVADRFLGDAGRAGEILDLNSGRVQPDGGRLSDPGRLRAGWHLVLPWDAIGTELRHGSPPASAEPSSGCARETAVPAAASWGQTLLTPSRVWSVTDGSGVKVAVVGSGVDGAATELSGRVAAGTDVATGTGRADTGCEGSGTALAGIVAGADGTGGEIFGVAPGARVVPVNAGTAKLSARLAATGIDVAVASGARVVLVGAGVDAAEPVVRAAISDAISQDVVVVLPASAAADPADGLLRVGAIREDRQPADDYPDDAVDLLAPGVGVASIGRSGSGAEYAAAFVAGTVALVRSAHPGLRAAEVTRQVLTTVAEGVVSPVAAVTAPLPAGGRTNAAVTEPSGSLVTLSQVLYGIAVGLALLLLLPFLFQRSARILTQVVARRRAKRQAQQARARVADDNDVFWEPPTGGPGRPVRQAEQ
ncbi:S8 family serine peptidase [Plantactinospora sp. KLBMP9567]|uniref:S8 family serine peptidase n=1 Tax=Plantactinospora sp. KLBMP9567 TaxID=3085900 RepID=UPI002982090C|nr:S8 family serine peptidase [Plantactinospora sp. KLBMP9567]MDW5323213.1 S8 family serine peptidase [Plantactinospora sp. KLBMP9567]